MNWQLEGPLPDFYGRNFHNQYNHNCYCMTWRLEGKDILICTLNRKLYVLILSLHLDRNGKNCFCCLMVMTMMVDGFCFFNCIDIFVKRKLTHLPFEYKTQNNFFRESNYLDKTDTSEYGSYSSKLLLGFVIHLQLLAVTCIILLSLYSLVFQCLITAWGKFSLFHTIDAILISFDFQNSGTVFEG